MDDVIARMLKQTRRWQFVTLGIVGACRSGHQVPQIVVEPA